MTPTEELETLRARLEDLESVLRRRDGVDLALAFKLPPLMEQLLMLLLALPRVTSEVISQRLELASEPKVAIWRLRRYLEPSGVKIQSQRVLGYWIEPDDKAELIRRAAAIHQTKEPRDGLAA